MYKRSKFNSRTSRTEKNSGLPEVSAFFKFGPKRFRPFLSSVLFKFGPKRFRSLLCSAPFKFGTKRFRPFLGSSLFKFGPPIFFASFQVQLH